MRKNRKLPQGEVRRLEIDSKALAGNMLGDPSRRDLYVYLAGDRLALGPAGLGRMVGLGRASYFNFDPDVSVHWIHFVAILN